MIRKGFFTLLLPFTFYLLPSSSFATHLMGGNLSYEYLGETSPGSNQFRYRITLVTFQDCSSPNWFTNGGGLPDGDADIGIFQGSATPTSDMPWVTNLNLPLVDSGSVTPPLPNGCVIPSMPCVYQVTYSEIVVLSLSFSGYHVYYDRCCRNGSIVNLTNPGAQGMAFHAYIPPTIVVNNSPVFTDMPVPFICVNDTTGILNTASDPDGDLLIFSFEDPYEGEYTGPGTPPPAIGDYSAISPINVPFPPITWASGGFNKNNPFGPSGYAFINSFTGYSQYKPNATGNYVIAVEIKEYRNGILIGITRRDMQLLVITCDPNSTPVLSNTGGSGNLDTTIQEGQPICFPITFTDADTFTVSASGAIFNSSFTNPAATITTPITGSGTITTQFCWNTGCNQGQSLPYLFNVEATDSGCPPKTTPEVYSITVNNFNGPTTITGTNTVCPGISGLSYSITGVTGASYNWVVTGGTIVSGQGTTSIVVNWGNGPSGNVAVTTTSQFGCPSGPINLPVSFNAAVDVLAGTDKTICVGDTVTIGSSPTAPSGAVLTWSPSSGLSCTNCQNPIASPNSTTTYIASAINGSGCSDADTIIVTVSSAPNANAGNDTTICLSGSVQLNASGGTTYLWSPSTNLSCTNCQNPVATPNDTITYSVIVSSSANCKDTDEVTVNIITDTPANAGTDKTICAGDSVQIGSSMIVPLGATLNWTPNVSLSNNSILNPVAFPSSSTNYILQIITSTGCVGVDTMLVNVNPLPLANAGNDTLICNGDTMQFSASGGGTYQWSPGSGLSNTNISNPLAFPLSNTQYIVDVTLNGCTKKDTILLQVANVVNVTAADSEICVGDTVQLSANCNCGIQTFLWSPSASLSANNISNPLAFPSGTVEYFLTATDTNSCTNIDSVTISVNQLPVVDAGADSEICIGDSAQLNATGGLTFVWTPFLTLTDDSIQNPKAFPNDTTTYFVSATDIKSCSNIDSVTIIVNPLPIVLASNDTAICKNTSAQLNATGGSSYLWTPSSSLNNPNIQNPQANPNDTTKYFVIATDANNCKNTDSVTVNIFPDVITVSADTGICINDTVQLFVTGGASFLWSPATSLDDFSIANPLAFPTDTTTYFVNVTDTNSCANFDSVKVDVYPLPLVNASNDTAICFGSNATLDAGNGFSNYLWNTNETTQTISVNSSGTFFVTVSDSKNCSNNDSVKIIVNPLPIAQASNDTTICEGAIVQLNSSGGTTFLWSPNSFLDNQNISNPQSTPNDTINYLVIVSDVNNCSDTDSVKISVNKLPLADAGEDAWLCPGDSAQLIALGGNFFSWTPALTLSNSGISNPRASPSDTTQYFVTVTDLNSCSKTDSVTVFVNGIVPTNAGNDMFICLNDSAQIGGSPTSPSGTIFSWSPSASLSDNTISNPFAKPNDTTMYYVFTTNDTCTGMDSVQVIVNPLPIADAGLNSEICIGDSVQLNATGGINFVWSPAATLTDDSIQNPKAFPNDTTTFYVTVIDGNSCRNSDSVKIDVNDLPVVDAGIDKEICIGDSVQITAITSATATFSWTPTSSLNNSAIDTPLAFPSDTTKYFLTITDTNNCKNSDSVIVFVNQLPNANAGNDVEICVGDSAQLNASGGTFFVWNNSVSLSDDSIANPFAFPNDTTVFIVNITDAKNCSKSDSVTVVVNFLPIVDAGIDAEICIGDSTQLNATGGTTFVWTPSVTLTDDSIQNPKAFPNDTTVYLVTATDAKNCSNNDSVTIIVNPLPIVFAGNDTSICKNTSAQLNAIGGIFYLWSFDLTLSDTVISNPVASPSDTTKYFVSAIDGNGCKNTDSVTVNIFPDVVTLSADTGICINDSVQLFVSGGAVFAWSPSASLNDATVSNPIAFPSDTTTYFVNVTDTNSCANFDSVIVNIFPLPVITKSNDTAVCFGNCVQLFAGGGNNFLWFPATDLDNPNIANPLSCATDTITYFVSVTDSKNCSNNDSVKIIVNPLPVAQASNDTTICEGNSVQLNSSGGTNYLWNPNSFLDNQNISNPQSTPNDTIEYFVVVSDVNNCSDTDSVQINVNKLPDANAGNDTAICFGDTTQLNASGGTIFVWNNPISLSDDSISNPFAFPNDTTIYIVNISDANNCSKTDSVIVFVNPLPTTSITSASDEICIGDSMLLNASGGTIFIWNTDSTLSSDSIANPICFPSDTAIYFVKITNGNGCSKMDSIQIDVNNLPIVDAGNEINSCKNSGVILGGSPTAPASSTFLWTPATNLNDVTLANPTAAPDSTTTYFVNAIDSNGCKNSDSTVVSVFSVAAISDTSFCKGETVQLFVSPVSASYPVTYLWSPDSGLNSTVDSLVIASPDSNKIYTVIVTDANDCSETKTISLIANTPPIADFTFTLLPSCDGVFAEFKNKSSSDAISFQWLFGDGNSSSEEKVNHIFTYNQLMEVSLTAFNEFCKNEKSYNENIKNFTDHFNLIPANVFTPNNDGKNDCFQIDPENKLQQCSELRVFNRWGELMFVSGGNQHTWCGKNFAGEDVPSGTYFYIFDINGILFKGSVMLIR